MTDSPQKNLAQNKDRTVALSAEIADMLDAYAKAEGITRDLAARQLIRDGLEGATHAGGLPVLKGKSRVLIHNANKRHLRPAGYEIKGEHTGHGAFGRYRLLKCEAVA